MNQEEQSCIKNDFEALCTQYGLQEGEGRVFLEGIFGFKRMGHLDLPSLCFEKQPAFEIARMLKQLLYTDRDFSLKVGGNKVDYSNHSLVEVLKQLLEEALKERVQKYDETWICPSSLGHNDFPKDKSYNVGPSMSIVLIPLTGLEKRILYPSGVQLSRDSFSVEELDAIIKAGDELKEVLEKLSGNLMDYSSHSRNPDLGKLALSFKEKLPGEWNDATKNSFIADYMLKAGFLDVKGDSWLDGFKDKGKGEKDRQVRDWINSYERAKEKH